MLLALVAVLLGLLGNVIRDPINVEIFQVYLIATVAVVAIMFLRIQILKAALYVSQATMQGLASPSTCV